MCTEEYVDSTDETQGIGDIGDEEVIEGEGEVLNDAGGGEGNPWAWAEGLDPANVQKTYQKFTQETQNLSTQRQEVQQMRDELAPLNRLRDQLQQDPGLVAAIEQYFASGQQDPKYELAGVKQELAQVQTSIAVNRELADVAKWVRKNNLPDFDDKELVEYAGTNRIGNLKAAYQAMNFDRVQNMKAEQLTEDIKRGKNAALPKSRRADTAGKKHYTEEEIADMSDEDFQKNFGDIVGSFQQ